LSEAVTLANGNICACCCQMPAVLAPTSHLPSLKMQARFVTLCSFCRRHAQAAVLVWCETVMEALNTPEVLLPPHVVVTATAGATHWQLFPDWYAALLGEPLEVLC